jgi:phosphoglucosamine mutase
MQDSMSRLFGTDGIRGRANQPPLTAELALRAGRAAATVLARADRRAPVVIGQDPRRSGDMLSRAAAAGVLSAGLDACLVGVVPTPAVARLVVETGAPLGIMISASHNPFEDNGIKMFQADGFKPDDATEARIEELILDRSEAPGNTPVAPGTMRVVDDPRERYRRFVAAAVGPLADSGLKVVLDCANGAASAVAPGIFRQAGLDLTVIADHPDGSNINDRCGSQHPETLRRTVTAVGADVGLAFDGDADRVLAVDETGRGLTGDQLIAIFARHMDEKGRLVPRRVVTTVMSNMGLKLALEKMGIAQETSAVGDRRVMERMRATGAILGGEDSGHIIFRDVHTTGDGILSGLRLVQIMAETGRPLSALASVMTVLPQVLRNVPVSAKPPIAEVAAVAEEIRAAEAALAGRGRVLVRYSGTEPLCRVMVEAQSDEAAERLCARIATAVETAIGA